MTTSLTFTLIPDPRDPFEAPGMTEAQWITYLRDCVNARGRGVTLVVTK